ncbi:hypothetical protein COLO4_30466 [Corchorus olitorius]|uniref:A-kinase anchor protein 7-like phosphoesterase domain-containing protein n=1 Tax=Corchorus olitorius TaxID=93759 RepID=A0A1R3H8F2_9ROSI|nr:hypothetical protein COLO4_30466 [Corchorus olitorius]
MLKLWNKERVNLAAESISSQVMDALDNRPLFIRLKGLDCMRGSLAKAQVVYAPVEEIGGENRLLRACKVINDAFTEAGLVLERDARHEVKLHATVMNGRHRRRFHPVLFPYFCLNFLFQVWRKNQRKNSGPFDARGIFKQFGSEEWGEYLIREAHLSQRFRFDENGYYHCCASIPFPESMQVLKKGGREWKSLQVPDDFTQEYSRFYGSSVFEDGNKILILLLDTCYGEMLWIYNTESDKWEAPRKVASPGYTFPLNNLDLFNSTKSFVINAFGWSVREAMQKPLGLMEIVPLTEPNWQRGVDRVDRGDVSPCSWHLVHLRSQRFRLLSLYRDRTEGATFKTYVRFGTFDLVQRPPDASDPCQHDIRNLEIKFIDIENNRDLLLLPYKFVCSQV